MHCLAIAVQDEMARHLAGIHLHNSMFGFYLIVVRNLKSGLILKYIVFDPLNLQGCVCVCVEREGTILKILRSVKRTNFLRWFLSIKVGNLMFIGFFFLANQHPFHLKRYLQMSTVYDVLLFFLLFYKHVLVHFAKAQYSPLQSTI